MPIAGMFWRVPLPYIHSLLWLSIVVFLVHTERAYGESARPLCINKLPLLIYPSNRLAHFVPALIWCMPPPLLVMLVMLVMRHSFGVESPFGRQTGTVLKGVYMKCIMKCKRTAKASTYEPTLVYGVNPPIGAPGYTTTPRLINQRVSGWLSLPELPVLGSSSLPIPFPM